MAGDNDQPTDEFDCCNVVEK